MRKNDTLQTFDIFLSSWYRLSLTKLCWIVQLQNIFFYAFTIIYLNAVFELTCSNGTGIYISTQLIFLSFVIASNFKLPAMSFTFSNDIFSSSSPLMSLVDIINRSQYLTLHTLEVDALIPDGSIFSPRIRFITLDFPALVSPNDENYICYNC